MKSIGYTLNISKFKQIAKGLSAINLLNISIILASCFVLDSQLAEAQEGRDNSRISPKITVSADPLEPGLFEFGRPASVIEQDELARRNQSTLGETIGLEPGVSSSFFGQGSSRPVIRGFAGDRIRVLKNGVGTGDVSNISEDHVVVADPLQSKKIEILRGPETLLYGSSAIGGVVNVIDDSIAEQPLGEPFKADIIGQLGDSSDNEKTVGAKLLGESGNFNWHLSGFYRRSDDYEIPGFAESSRLREAEAFEQIDEHDDHEQGEGDDHDDEVRGKVLNTDTETRGGTIGSSYVWDRGFLGASVSGFDSDYGVPGHAHEEEHDHEEEGEEEVRIDARQVRYDIRGGLYDVSQSIESLKYRLSYADYKHDELENGAVGTKFRKDTFEGRLDLVHAPIGSLSGSAGFQFLYEDFSAIGEEAFLLPTKTFSPAIYLFETIPLNGQASLHLDFGGRVELVSHDPQGLQSEEFVPFSLSVGPRWNPTGSDDYTVALTLAYTERAPSAVELFANGPHLARQIFEVGDSSLSKEASWGADLVFRKNRGVVTGAFTPFYQHYTNYINLNGSSEESDGLPLFVYEELDAYFWGFELQSALHLGEILDLGEKNLALEYQLDYVRARSDDSQNLPRIPPLRNIVRARYGFSEWFESYVEGVMVSNQSDVSEFELPTDSYALLNVGASVKLPFAKERDLRLFARGTNLTNEEARVHTSFLKDLAPLRGRSFLFGVQGSL